MSLSTSEQETLLSTGEEDPGQFFQEISRYPLLTPAQEREVAIGCAAGDRDAIRRMVNSNLRLVVRIARSYAGRGVALMDLIQEGSLGLLRAAEKFDYTRDTRFSTYAGKWIHQRIGRYLLNQAGLIYIPAHTAELMRKLIVARNRLRQTLEREPSTDEIALEAGLEEKKVEKLLQLLPEIGSLDTPVGEDGDGTLQAMLQDLCAPQPQEEMVRQELKRTIDTLLGMLTTRQQEVLRLRFGIDDGESRSFEEVGRILGITKERARQLERDGLKNLKKLGADFGLGDFLE